MKRRFAATAAITTAAALTLAGCSGGGGGDQAASGPVTLTLSGWSLDATPEFKTLADGFHASNPDVTIKLKEYDATNYDTLMTADLSAGTGPDIITQKNVKNVVTYQQGNQLMDVSDVKLPAGIGGADAYQVDGKQYAVPYRQDSWVLYYNKALFEKAGVDQPDGSWTWTDYADAAAELTSGLKSAGSKALGTYEHSWQSTVQGFANAQAQGADILKGNYAYMKPYYAQALALQKAGDQVAYNTVTANQLTYQAEFGKQDAAMMLMGTWYVATLISQQQSGEADKFDWGFAPAPQATSATAGTSATPVSFGDPTGFAINQNIDSSKVAAAKEFLAYAAGTEGASSLAKIGITPALTSDTVADAYFSVDGAPTDDLSRFTWSTRDVKSENPTSAKTAAVQNILLDLHTGVMSGADSVDQAITKAQQRVANEVGLN